MSLLSGIKSFTNNEKQDISLKHQCQNKKKVNNNE